MKEAEGSYAFRLLMLDFKEKALNDEIAVWFLFKSIIKECIESPDYFETNPSAIVSTFYILNDIDNEKSFALLKWFIQNCNENTPNGAIELLSTLITSFSNLDFKEFHTYSKSQNQAISGIGYLTIYNLFMEGRLSKEEAEKVLEISKNYNNNRYHISDTHETLKFRFRELYSDENYDNSEIDLNLL